MALRNGKKGKKDKITRGKGGEKYGKKETKRGKGWKGERVALTSKVASGSDEVLLYWHLLNVDSVIHNHVIRA